MDRYRLIFSRTHLRLHEFPCDIFQSHNEIKFEYNPRTPKLSSYPSYSCITYIFTQFVTHQVGEKEYARKVNV